MLQANPIIVQVVEEPVRSTTVADVVIGALGLTGVLILAAALLGAILGGILIGIKLLRARYNLEPIPDSEALRVTPDSTREIRPNAGRAS
ncbi:MAG TPA: hypothetical protein VLD67_19885 [Vicinamibacterales bacterium]|nr:hypothetical protein [Vicinamibacterales bacterium]